MTGIDWDRLYHGICPNCHEDKFIGHGPLCVDCITPPMTAPDTNRGNHRD